MGIKLGIIGSRGTYFNNPDEAKGRMFTLLDRLVYRGDLIVSGGCPLGGVDLWAKNYAQYKGFPYTEYAPKDYTSESFRERNQQIVDNCDELIVFLTKKYGLTTGSNMTTYMAIKKGIPIKIYFVE